MSQTIAPVPPPNTTAAPANATRATAGDTTQVDAGTSADFDATLELETTHLYGPAPPGSDPPTEASRARTANAEGASLGSDASVPPPQVTADAIPLVVEMPGGLVRAPAGELAEAARRELSGGAIEVAQPDQPSLLAQAMPTAPTKAAPTPDDSADAGVEQTHGTGEVSSEPAAIEPNLPATSAALDTSPTPRAASPAPTGDALPTSPTEPTAAEPAPPAPLPAEPAPPAPSPTEPATAAPAAAVAGSEASSGPTQPESTTAEGHSAAPSQPAEPRALAAEAQASGSQAAASAAPATAAPAAPAANGDPARSDSQPAPAPHAPDRAEERTAGAAASSTPPATDADRARPAQPDAMPTQAALTASASGAAPERQPDAASATAQPVAVVGAGEAGPSEARVSEPARPSNELPRMHARLHDLGARTEAAIRLAVRDGHTFARITMRPPELGAIEIRLHYRGGELLAEVRAENAQTLGVLSQQAGDLRRQLEARGITLSDFQLHQSSQDGGTRGDNAGHVEPDGNRRASSDDANDENNELAIETFRRHPSAVRLDVLA